MIEIVSHLLIFLFAAFDSSTADNKAPLISFQTPSCVPQNTYCFSLHQSSVSSLFLLVYIFVSHPSMDNHHKYCYRKERENSNPSFSSILLDAIYRSIDETEPPQEGKQELVMYKETMRKKHSSNMSSFRADHAGFKDEIDMANFQRACLIEKWMEKKVVVRRKSAADFERKSRNDADAVFFNSSSSSSDSSSGGGFSSSEAESAYGVSSRSSSCYGYGLHKPKPIRTSVSAHQPEKFNKREKDFNFNVYDGGHNYQPKPKQEGGGFVKTKSRALKIYGDLKKVKQPISPGGRLASFLNSIFTAVNAKKAKISSSNNIGVGAYDDATSERKLKSANASTCSSASSFSRSCLSKTSSSRGKSSSGMKRSVRFYPVSVIVDEDCQPCGQKSLYDDKPSMDLDTVKNNIRSSINEELKFHVMEKNRKVEETARDLLRNFQKVEREQVDMRNARIKSQVFDHHVDDEIEDEEEDDLDDDAASYASSDLFELDNLSAIGMDRYREELPVYETTHLGTNRAIANGLIL